MYPSNIFLSSMFQCLTMEFGYYGLTKYLVWKLNHKVVTDLQNQYTLVRPNSSSLSNPNKDNPHK